MLTKEKLTNAYEQGLSISTKSGTKLKIVANLMDVFAIQYYNSTKIEWFSIEKFNELQCTIEQHKQKIDLSILKEGEIYFGKTNESNWIFKFKELTNNNNIRGHFFYDFEYYTNIYEGDSSILKELRLPTDSELELFYSKFPELKPKPKYNGRAVKCDTVEQILWYCKHKDSEITKSRAIELLNDYKNNLGVENNRVYSINYAKDMNIEIISFSDYCKENGIKEPKWIKGFEVRDGYNDVVMVSDNLKSWHINILQSVNNGLQPFNCGFHSWKHCRYLNKNEINEIKFVD